MILVLTGQSMAIARGASGPVGEMVLCTGTGPVQIHVDENGKPTKPPQYCPDCALTLLVDMPARGVVLLPLVARPADLLALAPIPVRLSSLRRATARAPPRLV